MRLELIADDAGKFNLTRVEHKGRALNLQVVLYVKSLLRIKFDIYAEVNGFLASLPLELQDRLFEQYFKVFDVMEDISGQGDSSELIERISREVTKLFDLVPEQLCNDWIRNPKSGIRLPPEVNRDMDEDMTYSLDDHVKLAGYSMILRLMMPIWGTYNRSANEEKETAFKEMNAIQLIAYSWLSTCRARERLKVYIARVLQSAANSTSVTAVFAGIGRDQTVDYHLSKTIVRRLPISPIDNEPESDKSTLVSNVYNYIKPTQMTSLDRNFDLLVDDKHRFSYGRDDDRSSFTENFKIKERLSAGDAVMLSKSMSKLMPLISSIDPTVPKDIIKDCKAVMNNHDVTHMHAHQLALLKMVVGITFSPDSIDCVDRPAILSALCATQSVLWHWGFTSLAAMLTVTVPEDSLRRERSQSNRLSKEESLKMRELYPHHIPVSRNFKGDEYAKAEKENTTSFIVIRDFAEWTESQVWLTSCPERLLDQYIGQCAQRHIVTPDNVKSMIAKLIIRINQAIDDNYKRKQAEKQHAV